MWVIVRDIVLEDLRRLVRRALRRPEPPLPYARRRRSPGVEPPAGPVDPPRHGPSS